MLVASHDSLIDKFVDRILRMNDGQIIDEEILEPQQA